MKLAVIFLNRFFHPDISATSQMVSDLAFQLAEEQQNIHVIASRLLYDSPSASLPAYEFFRGVHIHRVWSSRFGRASLIGRMVDYLTFYVSAPLKLLCLVSRGDVVVAKTDPPLISVPILFAAKLRGAHLVNWLQDLFPEVAISLGMRLGGSVPQALLKWARNASLRHAKANVVLGRRMAERIIQNVPSAFIREIPNWSPNADVSPIPRLENPLNTQWHLADRFVVGYSGNLGRAHELGIVLKAASLLKHRPEIVFLIIGDGNQKQALQDEATQEGLVNVLFKPYQPADKVKFSLALPDVHLVSLKPSLEGLIVPSKFYGILAAGRAAIFIGDAKGELALEIDNATCGMNIAPDDASGLASAIERLASDRSACKAMGDRGRALFDAKFTRDLAMARWRAVLEGTAK